MLLSDGCRYHRVLKNKCKACDTSGTLWLRLLAIILMTGFAIYLMFALLINQIKKEGGFDMVAGRTINMYDGTDDAAQVFGTLLGIIHITVGAAQVCYTLTRPPPEDSFGILHF